MAVRCEVWTLGEVLYCRSGLQSTNLTDPLSKYPANAISTFYGGSISLSRIASNSVLPAKFLYIGDSTLDAIPPGQTAFTLTLLMELLPIANLDRVSF
jgi:hypothetical protein